MYLTERGINITIAMKSGEKMVPVLVHINTINMLNEMIGIGNPIQLIEAKEAIPQIYLETLEVMQCLIITLFWVLKGN